MSDCAFCKGRPVVDAATWADGKPRPPVPCPRCGEVGTDTSPRPEISVDHEDFEEAAAKRLREYQERTGHPF